MADPTELKTIQYLTEGGGYRMPVDSGMGELYRPFSGASQGGCVSTLETLYEFWIKDVPDLDEALRLDPNIRQKMRMHPDARGIGGGAAFIRGFENQKGNAERCRQAA